MVQKFNLVKSATEHLPEELKDLYDLVSPFLPIAKYVSPVISYARFKRFTSFLEGLHKKLEDIEPEGTVKVIKKINKNDELLKDVSSMMVDKASNTYSNKTAAMLGIYLGEVYRNEEKLKEPTTAIFIQALENMNDYDIDVFIKVYQFIEEYAFDERRGFTPGQIYYGEPEQRAFAEDWQYNVVEDDKNTSDLAGFISSTSKLQRLQLLSFQGLLAFDHDPVAYTTNYFSTEFYALLQKYNKLFENEKSPSN